MCFIVNLWYYDVHIPLEGKPEHIAYFEEKRKRMGLDQKDPFMIGDHFPVETRKHERITRRLFHSDPVYASMIYNTDWNIGRLLDVLEKEGLMDNTLILFTSDNGGLATSKGSPTCNAPAREGKGWVYDGGTRVPALAVWKNHIRPGSSCDTPICTPDYYPTILEAVGLPLNPKQHCDGVSLKGLLTETAGLPERPLFWHYPHYAEHGGTPGASVIVGEYKLIQFFEDMRIELYHLINDPGEDHNLRNEMPEKADELLGLLQNWMDSVNAILPEKNPDYIPW